MGVDVDSGEVDELVEVVVDEAVEDDGVLVVLAAD